MSGAVISQSKSVPIVKEGEILGQAEIKIEVAVSLNQKVTGEIEESVIDAITKVIQKL